MSRIAKHHRMRKRQLWHVCDPVGDRSDCLRTSKYVNQWWINQIHKIKWSGMVGTRAGSRNIIHKRFVHRMAVFSCALCLSLYLWLITFSAQININLHTFYGIHDSWKKYRCQYFNKNKWIRLLKNYTNIIDEKIIWDEFIVSDRCLNGNRQLSD